MKQIAGEVPPRRADGRLDFNPSPNRWHPHLSDSVAHFLQDAMRGPNPYGPFVYIEPAEDLRTLWTMDDEKLAEPIEIVRHTVTVGRMYGPAHYVGEPFAYRWNVGYDERGRWVTTDSWIEYLPEDAAWRR